MLECIPGEWIIDKASTKTEDGLKHNECTQCGKKVNEVVISAGSVGFEYRVRSDGKSCAITGIGTCIDTEIVIPKSIDGYKVTKIDVHAFQGCTSLTSVVISDSVISIEGHAFTSCASLTSIEIPDSVTSIGGAAFWGCDSLKSIKIPNSVKIISWETFWGCNSLSNIEIPDSVTTIDGVAFLGCASLTSIEIPDSVTSIGDIAFANCTSLTSVEIGYSVTRICKHAFYNCTSLTSITFKGTVEQWNAIELGYGWNEYIPATEVVCSDGTVSLE
jgi:hypothetical protein